MRDTDTSASVAQPAGAIRRWYTEDPAKLFDRNPIGEEYLIVDSGKLAGSGAESYELT